MTVERKCIYCNTAEDLSKSDIIPDALTNSKILNKNVCRVEHNNEFSDLFESEVIAGLAFITNELDIKSSKSKSYPIYNAIFKIDEVEYDVKKLSSDAHLLKNGSVLQSVDKRFKLGPLDTINKIAKERSEVIEIDMNNQEIQKSVIIKPNVFFSEAICRLVSKIAYEWYCAKNKIIGKHSNFNNIVSYITTGQGQNPASILTSPSVYDTLNELCSHGSHSLFTYVQENSINVVVNLFGVAIYNVKLSDSIFDQNLKNCMYQELLTDGSKVEVFHESLQALINEIGKTMDNFFQSIQGGNNNFIPTPQTKDMHLDIKFRLCQLIDTIPYAEKGEILKPNEQAVNLIIKNINNLLHASLIHKNSLKRFVKENLKFDDTNFKLNPDSTDKKNTFLFYVVYLIGKSSNKRLDLEIVNSIIKSGIGTTLNEIVLTEDSCKSFRRVILEDENYQEILLKGSEIIKSWD